MSYGPWWDFEVSGVCSGGVGVGSFHPRDTHVERHPTRAGSCRVT